MARWHVIRTADDGSAIVENTVVLKDGHAPHRRQGALEHVRPKFERDQGGNWRPPATDSNWLLIVERDDGTAFVDDGLEAPAGVDILEAVDQLEAIGPGWTRGRNGKWKAPPAAVDQVEGDGEE
jgi:hypothetical protein